MNYFFSDWDAIVRAGIVTIVCYLILLIFLRISGKRTLSKMNAFDFVVTIALGSTLSTMTLNKSVSVAEGATELLVLILMQYIITSLSVRSKKVKNFVTSHPTMLLYKGEILHQNLRKERITLDELFLAARQGGYSKLEEIDVIILESTGDISIVKAMSENGNNALSDVSK